MKIISLASLLALFVVTACNSNSNGSSEGDTTATHTTGVENVNGNIPDTSNTINLGAADSSTTTQDSVHH